MREFDALMRPRRPTRAASAHTHIRPTEVVRIAAATLAAHPLRAALTTLGVMIGVAAVVALTALGRGAQHEITERLSAGGANLLTVVPGSLAVGGVGGDAGRITLEDADALINPRRAPSVAAVSPEVTSAADVSRGDVAASTRVFGVTPAYLDVHDGSVAVGAFLTDAHLRSGARVAVLGARLAQTLFGATSPLGERVRVNGVPLRVIGVLAESGGDAFVSIDDSLLVPLTTAQRTLFGAELTPVGETVIGSIAVQAHGQDRLDAARGEVRAVLSARRRGAAGGFTIYSNQDLIATLVESRRALTAYLSAIAGIALVVGGIGVMNIMLVSVRERTREIGLRKAVGARERDILAQFLVEALLLSLSGGVAGLALGVLAAWGAEATGQGRAIVGADAGVLAVGVALLVGLVFGIAPARSAARLDPIVALRAE